MRSRNQAGFDEVIFFEGIIKKNPRYVHALIPLAEAYTTKGLYRKGLELDQRLSKLCPKDPFIRYNLACSFALTGQKEDALAALMKAVSLGYRDFKHLKKDPDLKSLHSDPRFHTLITEKRAVKKRKRSFN